MAIAPPDTSAIRILGVDDFAWKKRLRYGTILVDLEQHKIIDVLLDRSDTTFTQWLTEHPTVEVICRDRASDYAKAANQAAPQALQVADRFHLIRNLADALTPLLSRCQKEAQSTAQEPSLSLPSSAAPIASRPLPTPQTWQQQTPEVVEQRHQLRQAERDQRYQQMCELREHGLTQAQIAAQMGVGVRTVRSWLKAGAAPSWKRRFRRRSIFDPYAAYVLQRWQSGVHDGKQLYEEIRAQGFTGSHGIVKRFLQTLRGKRGKPRPNQDPPATKRPAPNNPTWLFIRQEKDLTAEERIELFLLCQHSPTAKLAYLLVQAFLTMLRQRRGEEFEGWVQAAEVSHIPELERFALNLQRDRKAVEAGLTYAYSSGPVEAQVHKLKLVKRSMYGRAKLPLLRQRLLHAI